MADLTPVVALFGATALGKSDVALELAERLQAEIVVADSMQVYAGLPILTNQPGTEARRRATYHLVAWKAPQEECSAAEYAVRRARGRGWTARGRTTRDRGGRLRSLPARRAR